MAEILSPLTWQLQTNIFINEKTGLMQGGPPLNLNAINDTKDAKDAKDAKNAKNAKNAKDAVSSSSSSSSSFFDQPLPRIGGTMTSFKSTEDEMYGVLLIGGLRVTYADMLSFQQNGIGSKQALSGTTGGAPCQLLLRTKSIHSIWEWQTFTFDEKDHDPTRILPKEAKAMLLGGTHGLVQGTTVSLLASGSSSNSIRFAVYGGYTQSYGTTFSPLSILDIW